MNTQEVRQHDTIIAAFIILFIVVIIYYADVYQEAFGTKFYGNKIATKKEFFFYLIPFSLWVARFAEQYKNLK